MVQDFLDNKICIQLDKSCLDMLPDLRIKLNDLKWNSNDPIDSDMTVRIVEQNKTIYLNTSGISIWYSTEPHVLVVTLKEFLQMKDVEVNEDELMTVFD